MDRAHAFGLVNEHVKDPGLVRHMLAVEAAMRAYARKLGQDEETWGIVGLLHDFDYERWPTPPDHPIQGSAILKGHGYPEEVIYAIKSHADYLPDCPRVHLVDKALYACDELTGLITAAALVRPAGITDLSASSVKKKMKSRGFARNVSRDDITRGVQEFGVDLTEHIQFIIEALKPLARELHLANKRPAVFLDRDGTLIEECSYIAHPDQVRLIAGAATAMERLRRAGFACVVVTNQSGVGRALLTLEQMHAVNEEMNRQLRAAATQLDGLYFCTHAPLGADKTVIEHPDRKPGPGMLLRAAAELNLNLPASWMVGDSISDVLAGRHAGCRGQILVRSGHNLAEALAFLGNEAVVVDDLQQAADLILEEGF